MGRLLFRLLLLALVILAAGFLWLRSSLPRNDGRLTIAGLSTEVHIHRDARIYQKPANLARAATAQEKE